ncbi:cytochrome b [Crenobacter intestini]|uniref:Cytochrome b n=1 Tax=Crenobacter intestini TaxID=2563443 RepID=A0A4T0UU25_9NEIS|nr:cytochrome b [Crenobacter intestini]TIC82287.1 cytochrome b [Crenobacter intestini]
MLFNSRRSYGSVARAFHWLTFAALLVVLAMTQLRELFDKQSEARVEIWQWHISFGILVFLLTVPRLVWRLGSRVPDISPTPTRLDMLLAHVTHWTLYALLLITPLFGLWSLQAGDATVHFFGLSLPQLFGVDDALSHNLKEIHGTLGGTVFWLAVLHVAAALWHHWRLKDDTLTRMAGRERPD